MAGKAAASGKRAGRAGVRGRRPKTDRSRLGASAQSDVSFEDGMKRLEEIVQALEDGTRSLDESLELFGEAMTLIRICTSKLDAAEAKVQMLLKESGGDGLRLVDFDEGSEEYGLDSPEEEAADEEDEDDDGDDAF